MWIWIIKKSLIGALFVGAICAFVFNPLSYIRPEIKGEAEMLKAWLPLMAFGGAFIAGIIGFLLQWWITGKPERYLSTGKRIDTLERKVRRLEAKLKETKTRIKNRAK